MKGSAHHISRNLRHPFTFAGLKFFICSRKSAFSDARAVSSPLFPSSMGCTPIVSAFICRALFTLSTEAPVRDLRYILYPFEATRLVSLSSCRGKSIDGAISLSQNRHRVSDLPATAHAIRSPDQSIRRKYSARRSRGRCATQIPSRKIWTSWAQD